MELVFERKDGLSCVEFLYKAVAQYYSMDYELAFIDAWSFSYDMSTGVAISNEGNREMNLQKYHGIKVLSSILEGQENIVQRIKLLLAEKKMCMMRTDLYYIPWSASNYKKRHLNHAILITDVTHDGFFCYDFIQTKGEILPFDHIPNQVGVSSFELVTPEIKLNDVGDCKALLTRTITKGIADGHAFAQMDCFSKSFNDSFCIHEMISDPEIFENSYFINSINRIAQCRFQFAAVLAYLNALYPDLNLLDIESMLKKSAVYWKAITALLIKSYLLSDSSAIIKKISHKVLEAKALEEQAYIELQKIVKDNNLSERKAINETMTQHLSQKALWKFIDIKNHVNHKAFGDAVNTQHAQYEQNWFIRISQELEGQILSFDPFCFKLSNLSADKYDNIECAEQVIEINAECSEVALLANAEYDHQVDTMTVLGKESKHLIEISTTSWRCTPVLGDTVVWSGIGAVQNDGKILIGHGEKRLFGKIYQIPKMHVEKIVLPYNPNFHIFALSIR